MERCLFGPEHEKAKQQTPKLSHAGQMMEDEKPRYLLKEEARQVRIFTNWANFILSQRDISIASIAEDLSDGLVLIHLVELLIGRSVGRYNKKPRLMAHKIENVNIALSFLARYGVAVTTDVNAIVQRDLKGTLSLFWVMIKQFQLNDNLRMSPANRARNSSHTASTYSIEIGGGEDDLARLERDMEDFYEAENRRREEERNRVSAGASLRKKAIEEDERKRLEAQRQKLLEEEEERRLEEEIERQKEEVKELERLKRLEEARRRKKEEDDRRKKEEEERKLDEEIRRLEEEKRRLDRENREKEEAKRAAVAVRQLQKSPEEEERERRDQEELQRLREEDRLRRERQERKREERERRKREEEAAALERKRQEEEAARKKQQEEEEATRTAEELCKRQQEEEAAAREQQRQREEEAEQRMRMLERRAAGENTLHRNRTGDLQLEEERSGEWMDERGAHSNRDETIQRLQGEGRLVTLRRTPKDHDPDEAERQRLALERMRLEEEEAAREEEERQRKAAEAKRAEEDEKAKLAEEEQAALCRRRNQSLRFEDGDYSTKETSVSQGSTFQIGNATAEQQDSPCDICGLPLAQGLIVLVDSKDLYHLDCFVCTDCGAIFEEFYWEYDGKPLCFDHYLDAAGLRCAGCNQPIRDKVTRAMDQKWHAECFKCTTCGNKFDGGFYVQDGLPYCEHDYYRINKLLCARCDKMIGQGDKSALGKVWHRSCFTCTTCLQPFGAAGFFNWNGNPYCPEHYRLVKQGQGA